MLHILQLKKFRKEIMECPLATREDLFSLVLRFLNRERLSSNDLKVFKIDERIKVYEFRTKDHQGNWRIMSTILNDESLILIYAFHKKSQELLEKDKAIIRKRIKGYLHA